MTTCIKAFTFIFSYMNFLPIPWRLSIFNEAFFGRPMMDDELKASAADDHRVPHRLIVLRMAARLFPSVNKCQRVSISVNECHECHRVPLSATEGHRLPSSATECPECHQMTDTRDCPQVGCDFYGRPTESLWFNLSRKDRRAITILLNVAWITHFASQVGPLDRRLARRLAI